MGGLLKGGSARCNLPSSRCLLTAQYRGQHWDLASRMGHRVGSLHLRELRFVSILHEEYT